MEGRIGHDMITRGVGDEDVAVRGAACSRRQAEDGESVHVRGGGGVVLRHQRTVMAGHSPSSRRALGRRAVNAARYGDGDVTLHP